MEGQVEEDLLLQGCFLCLCNEALFVIGAGEVCTHVVNHLFEEGNKLPFMVPSCKQMAIEGHKLYVDIRALGAELVDAQSLPVNKSCENTWGMTGVGGNIEI